MICLTFDSDYVKNADMVRFLAETPISGAATFFLERPYELNWGVHEIGPHPFLVDVPSAWPDISEQMRSNIGCEKVGWRSHSLVSSQVMQTSLAKQGYRYSSTDFRMFESGARPYRHAWGLWELPIFYMDSADFCFEQNWNISHKTFDRKWIDIATRSPGLFVFDFHPLHLILNTPSYQYYCDSRAVIMRDDVSPFALTYSGVGTRTFFNDLVAAMEEQGMRSFSGSAAIAAFEEYGELALRPEFSKNT